MKLVILAALIAAVSSSPVLEAPQWPWQSGKVYTYDVDSYTWTKFEEGKANGNAFKTQFVVSVKGPGHLLAKLNNPSYAPVKAYWPDVSVAPTGLKYEPVQNIDQYFEIFVDGGRVVSMNFPSTFTVADENLFKGLISAIQVDLSTFGLVPDYPNLYDSETFQGLFKKSEADVTGECDTLYSVSPVSAEWRRELPEFSSEEDPIEIIKSKNYDVCKSRVAYYFGVPEGAVWKGLAYESEEKQFIKHSSEARFLVGKQGTIYKSNVFSSVLVNPLITGTQKAEVYSYVSFYLKSVEQDNSSESVKPKEFSAVKSLLYTDDSFSMRLFTYGDKQNVAKAQTLLQEITPLLQDPNQLPKGEFLTKFNILVYVLSAMKYDQLTQLTSSIEVAKSSKNAAKNSMWSVYRDAVAMTGRPESYEQIKSWIMAKKIEGEEAAAIISGIGSTLVNPPEELLADFFRFAISPEVKDQKALNTSALLASSKLFRFSKDEKTKVFLTDVVIPYLSKELKNSFENEYSSNDQVYITVLGNLADPAILKVYAPYLDGSIATTTYLRTQIVASLKTLANLRNEKVRAVLYGILKNTAEAYEVRVVAALNIFMAFPTADMFQVMAHMTNDDPSTQVRAVLANSITFAAGLKDPRFAELAKNAKYVLGLIAKEKFGYRYSTNSIIDGFTGEEDFSFFRELSFIGSENNILPKYQRSALRFKGTGFTEENQLTVSVSDMQDLIEYFVTQFYAQPTKAEPNFKFSAKQVAELLKIQRATRKPIEGSFFLEILDQQKLFTFTEQEMTEFLAALATNAAQLLNGFETNQSKVLLVNKVHVSFPLVTGMPFVFEYSEPTAYLLKLKSKVNVAKNMKSGSLENDIDITYAKNLDSTVGFLDTIGKSLTASGVINKLQIYVPAKISTTFGEKEVKVQFEPLYSGKDVTFLHFSVWPYTGLQKQDSITYEIEYVERADKTYRNDFSVGYYGFNGYSYSDDYQNFDKLFDSDDILTSFGNLLYQKDIALTVFNFKYIGKESTVKPFVLTFAYDTLYNQKNAGKMGPATITKFVEPNSKERREEMAKQVSAGIDAAEVTIYDISAEFNGEKKVDYVFTTAYAYSLVDPKFQAAFFVKGFKQFSAVFQLDTKDTKIVPLNFEEALKNQVKITYEADFKFEDNDVQVKGYGERSKYYTDLLKKDPLAKSCLEEFSQNNFYQMDCYKMIMKAHAPDYFKYIVTYNKVDSSYYDIFGYAYRALKDAYSWEDETNPLLTVADGKMEVEAQAYYYDNYINYKFTSPYGSLNLEKIEGMWYYQYYMAVYAPIGPWERSRNWFTGYQNLPYCAVDDSKVWTFSGRSYNYSLTGAWYVVMVDETATYSEGADLVILARRPSANQEEVYVSYKTETGKYFEIDITPKNVEVKTNGKKVSEGAFTSYIDETEDVPLLEYYTLAEGVEVFNLRNGRIRMVYDQQRLIIFSDDHRSTTRGLCGQSSSQTRDDYLTPWGLVDLPEYYGASFALEGEFCDAKTVELKKEAQLKAYQPVTKFTKIFH